MKTSLVSSPVSALASASATIRADRPQQLKSVAVYWRGRKMVLMQRPQRRLSLLLCGLLRRSMRSLFGSLPAKLNMGGAAKRVLSAGALCALALASATTAHATATVDTLPVNTLPDGYTVKYGQVGIGTNGNQMNVNIGTDKAIINWNSFSIGSQAGVDFHFNNATTSSSVLNRVTGNDPSKIMGSLTSNGKVFLINSAGILVGKTAKIDVAGFVASTLNISDSNFLAGRMMFEGQPGSKAGVMIEEDGSIKTSEGGSVYLIGANVENRGIITSPGGEVLLAAGESVELVDTGTPGVKIVVKGDKGKVKNLGKIIAKAGTIGFGAALIENDGMINASSVDKIGGRIFLRASKDLATSETSTINADGTEGGHVVLYADDMADIGGDVSALGNVDGKGGKGGYVDTSGKHRLAVRYAPRISAGGEWYIDPNNVDIVADYTSGGLFGTIENLLGGIFSNGTHSEIKASTITAQLNAGVSVSIVTGAIGSAGGDDGDITVHTNIITSSPTAPATLSLNAARNINILDNVTISDGGHANALRLEMVAGYNQPGGVITADHSGAIQASNATINVGGGFEAHAATYGMTGGSLTSSGPFAMDAALTTGTGANGGAAIIANNTVGSTTFGTVALNGGSTLTLNGGTVTLGATALDSTSSLTVQSAAHATMSGAITGTGTLNLGANGADTASLNAGSHAVAVNALHQKSGTLSGTAGLTVAGTVDQTGGTISFHDVSLTQNSGALTVGNITATDTLNLTATSGAIAQRVSTSLAAATLSATATAGITLANATNAVTGLTAINSTTGNIAYSGTGNLSLGEISNANRNVTIGTSSGAVTQTEAMTAGVVSVSAKNGITLTNAANSIAEFGATNLTAGDIALTTAGGVTLNQIANSAAAGDISVNAGGALSVYGALTTGNQVSLTSTSAIMQANLAAITAASLVATAHGGIDLLASNNHVGSFAATNYATGNISFKNNHGQPSGSALVLGNVDQQANDGPHDVTIINNGAISATGSVSNAGGVVNIESESGNIELGSVTAGSLNVTANQGNISQSDAVAVTGTVTANATTGITLDNTANAIATLAAANSGIGDITVKTNGGQPLTLNEVSTGNGNIAITTLANDIHLDGNLTTGTATNSITLNAGAGILQNSGVISTNKLTALAGGDNNLDAVGNNIRNYSGRSNTGNVSLHNTGTLETFGTTTTTFDPNYRIDLTTTGNLTVGGQINGGTINLTSGGDIAVNSKVEAAGTATLHADGAITQTIGISAAALNAIATTGIALNNAGNTVGSFSASNSNSGNIRFTNGSTQSLTLGHINNDHGNITVVASGAITADDTIFAGGTGTVDLTSAGALDMGFGGSITAGTINLTSQLANGDENINIGGDLTATDGGTITLNSANAISQQQNNNGGDATGHITAGTLSASAVGNVALNDGSGNSVGAFSGHSDTGNVELGNYGDLIVKDVSAPQGQVNISTTGKLTVNAAAAVSGSSIALASYGGVEGYSEGEGGPPTNADMAINGHLTATGGNGVNLYSDGLITQSTGAGTGITAASGTLDITSNGGANLASGNNSVGAFKAQNYGSGDIVLNNASANLLLNGTINNEAVGGNVSIINTGHITSTSNVVQEGQSPPYITNGTFADNQVTLTSTTGNVTLAKVVAKNLVVNAAQGKIDSVIGQISLQISDTMTAAAKTGITLNGNSNGTVINHIANFDGVNSGVGDITVYNQSTGESVNNLVRITNNTGNILVDNTGAMKTTGQISTQSGAVTLATHSPLTIGAGGVSATTGVNLSAGNGLGVTDTVVVNGAIHNVTGITSITGSHVAMNAPVFGPSPVFPGPNPPDFGSGYVWSPTIPTGATNSPPVIVIPPSTIDRSVASTSDNVNVNDITDTTPLTTSQPSTFNSASNQTTGGGDGEFGGEKDDGKGGKGEKSVKLPMCT